MSIDLTSLATAVATAVSGVAAAAAASELARRARRMEVGPVTISLRPQPAEKAEEIDWRARGSQALAALDDVSATEYALSATTQRRIDAQIDRAIEELERRSR
jgi:hypothetical protein